MAAALALRILKALGRGTKATGRTAGKAAKYGAAAGIGGAIGLGVNPWLGAAAGRGIAGMGWPGGKGAPGSAASKRDSSIIAGMRPHNEERKESVGRMKDSDDFDTKLNFIGKISLATYKATLKNNKELIYIQKMLQGPTAARAKELRMESSKGGGPVIINNTYVTDGGGRGGSGLLGPAALAGLAAALAAIIADPDTTVLTKGQGKTGGKTSTGRKLGRSWWAYERPGERAAWAEKQAAEKAERERLKTEKAERERIARERAIAERETRARQFAEKQRLAAELKAAKAAEKAARAAEKLALAEKAKATTLAEQAEKNRIKQLQLAEADKAKQLRLLQEKHGASSRTAGRLTWLASVEKMGRVPPLLPSRPVDQRALTDKTRFMAGQPATIMERMVANLHRVIEARTGPRSPIGLQLADINKEYRLQRLGLAMLGQTSSRSANFLRGLQVETGNLAKVLGVGFVEVGERVGEKFKGLGDRLKNAAIRISVLQKTIAFERAVRASMAFNEPAWQRTESLPRGRPVDPRALDAKTTHMQTVDAQRATKITSQQKFAEGWERIFGAQMDNRIAGTTQAKSGVIKGGIAAQIAKWGSQFYRTGPPDPKLGPKGNPSRGTTNPTSFWGERSAQLNQAYEERIQNQQKEKITAKIMSWLPKSWAGMIRGIADKAHKGAAAGGELGPKTNSFVNKFFLAAIIFGFVWIGYKWITNDYDPVNEERNTAEAQKACLELSKTLAWAIGIWVLLSAIINLALGALGIAFSTIPVAGWLMSAGLFIGKFWITDWILHNLGKWIPSLAPYLPPVRESGSWGDILSKKKGAFAKWIGQGSGEFGLHQEAGSLRAKMGSTFSRGGFDYTPFLLGRGNELRGDQTDFIARSRTDARVRRAQSLAAEHQASLSQTTMMGAAVNYQGALSALVPSSNKPTTTSGKTDAYDALSKVIMSGESAARGYKDFVKGSNFGSSMFVTEAFDPTRVKIRMLRDFQRAGQIGAVGKYQVIGSTLQMAIDAGVVDKNDVFNKTTQEKIYRWILESKRPEIGHYLRTGENQLAAQIAMAKEWASIGMPIDYDVTNKAGNVIRSIKAGQSYYAGVGNNKALIRPSQIVEALNALRVAFLADQISSNKAIASNQGSTTVNVIKGGDSLATVTNTDMSGLWTEHLGPPHSSGMTYSMA